MEYKVVLESFEGPLDLLLHLVDKSQVDIYDISIAEITDQYIEYLDKAEELDLEITSEFLVMAATLLEMKSKMLLPIEKKEELFDDEGIDPREELILKLLEYKKYKAAAVELKDKEILQSMIFSKPREEIEELTDIPMQLTIDGIELNTLVNALNTVLKKNKKTTETVTFDNITRDSITIEEGMEYIVAILTLKNRTTFDSIFIDKTTKFEIVVTFLGMLELIKIGRIFVYQEGNFDEIMIKLNPNYSPQEE